MTTGELITLQARQRRRLAQSAPFSPEWDAAMAALEDIEAALRVRASEASDASPSRPPSPDTSACGVVAIERSTSSIEPAIEPHD
jgi:hypothetical protein